jgi:hypothetical protein
MSSAPLRRRKPKRSLLSMALFSLASRENWKLQGRVRVRQHARGARQPHARSGGTPVAGAPQVTRHQVGGGAQVLHQARFEQQAAAFAQMAGEQLRRSRCDDEADGRADQQLHHRQAPLARVGFHEGWRHHRLQHWRFASLPLPVLASGPEA